MPRSEGASTLSQGEKTLAQPMTSADQQTLSGKSLWVRDESVALIDHTVGSLLRERSLERGDALALIGTAHGGDSRRLSYAEMDGEAHRVARALLRVAQPGELVALWAPNVVEWPIVQYGAALAGLVLAALNPALLAKDLTYALNHSQACVLVHANSARDHDLAATVDAVRADCPHLRSIVNLSDWDSWIQDEDGDDALPAPVADSPVMLQYTSGTTGKPKGVLLTHRALVNVAKLTMETAEVEAHSVSVNPLPMFHTASCVIGTLGPLWLGGCTVLVDRFEPTSVLQLIRREEASVLFFVPTVLGALLEAARQATEPPPSLRFVMGGAATVPPVMIDGAHKVFGAKVFNLFGQTELAPVLSMTRPGDSRDDLLRTVGRPLPQVDCKIVDPNTGRLQPLGEPGEICARGYQQFIEYLGDPAETMRTIDAEGWVHTGDLGAMDARGMITMTGRLKDLVIRGGENIAPAEIESCLLEHPAVLVAAVVGVPDARWGEEIAAVIGVRGQRSPGLRHALEAHCKQRLGSFKVPQKWFLIDALPVTPTGKVQKFKLLEAIRSTQLETLT
jgi:fatty-acyl-CoA synthase